MITKKRCVWHKCGAEFEPSPFQGNQQIFCSKRCNNASKSEKKRLNREVIWVLCNGIGCGRPFRQRNSRHKYCSRKCWLHIHKVRRRACLDPVTCAGHNCDQVFTPGKSTHRYCSQYCQRSTRHHREHQPKTYARRSCTECGTPFDPYRDSQKYCSKTCRERVQHRNYLSKPGNMEKKRELSRKWHEANPGYAKRMHEIYRKRKMLEQHA